MQAQRKGTERFNAEIKCRFNTDIKVCSQDCILYISFVIRFVIILFTSQFSPKTLSLFCYLLYIYNGMITLKDSPSLIISKLKICL